jgi:hypothetical protein
MTSSLPAELLEVLHLQVTTELVIIDERGRPTAWPVTPSLHADESCIDVEVAEAADPPANPHVALLLSDVEAERMVLVQGTAFVDERVHVRPERVYAWPGADAEAEPRLYDAHVEEVRSAHNEEPETGHAPPEGGPESWDERLEELQAATAAVAFVGPDGFPFAVRVPVRADQAGHVVRIYADPLGAPIEPGPACLCAHAHAEDLTWQRSYQVRGDLAEEDGRFVLHPHRVVAGLQLPSSAFERYRVNVRKVLRFRKTARDRERRGAGAAG